MQASPKADDVRTGRVGLAALAALGAALLAAAALATYEASLARAHAVRDAVPETASSALQYLPGSSQIGTLREPLMEARRAALRAGFDRDDAPIDAFDRLRSVPGHDDEARGLLAQFWGRKALVADNPLHRVLYALQARVVNDDEGARRTAASAMAALGPLRDARHVAEGTIVSADAGTLVMRGSGWLRVLNLETGKSFDLSDSDAGSVLVDGRWMVTWGDDTARIWDVGSASAAPASPAASFKLLAGETPVAFVGGSSGAAPGTSSSTPPGAPSNATPGAPDAPAKACVVTSAGRVWREGAAVGVVTVAHGRWRSASINPDCDRVVLQDDRIAVYRRRGDTWTSEPLRAPGKGVGASKGGPMGKPGEVQVEACAARAPRCVLRDATGGRSIWDFGSSPPRRLYEGLDCEARRFSPDGTRLMCRASQDGVTLYSEDSAGGWARADVLLPALTGPFLQDDGTICGSVPWKDATATDRSDVLFFAPQECPAPPAVERTWGTIHMLPTGNGAVFTFPPTEQDGSGYTEFLGFDSKGESLAAASNAWFGQRTDERLLEHDATNSAEEKGYELAGAPFDPALALAVPLADAAPPEHVSSVQIDKAFFVESPEPSVVLEIAFVRGSPSAPSVALRAVARWDARAKHFCGPAVPGAITSVAPTGDALAIDGRLYGIGACTAAVGFEPTDVTGVVAVAPDGARWIARDGESLRLQAPQREPIAVPSAGMRGEKEDDAQVAFNPNGDRFFVRTATSLCDWAMRGDGTLDLDGCRWSTAGWASDAAWAAADRGGETVVVFDRTAEGAALREFFGARQGGVPADGGGAVACSALPKADAPPLAILRQWEERLGHRFKDQATQLQDAREMASPEIVPMDVPTR